jgi:DNA processing protein
LLIEKFGSAAKTLAAPGAELEDIEGLTARQFRSIARADQTDAAAHLDFCLENGISLLPLSSPDYPAALKRIYDPPPVLYQRGALVPADEIAIAIVGARHATLYGLGIAERLGRSLSLAGFTIVSGLARGIDQAAHRGALAAGGRTLAVLGSGLLEIYPPEHVDLAGQIAVQGSLLSEAVPNQPARGNQFPRRNRIVTGLSLGVIIVEAAERSGALISAGLATEQGRDVFAVPGRVDSRLSRGCHKLIRDGAILVESVDDVLEQLGPLAAPVATATGQTMRHPAELKLTDQERSVLDANAVEATVIDEVVARSGLPVQRVLSTISILETRRLVRRLPGGAVARK